MRSATTITVAAALVMAMASCQASGVGSSRSPAQSAATSGTAFPVVSPVSLPSPSRPPVPRTALTITGAINVATDPALGENACFYGEPFPGAVKIVTPAMRLPDGQALAIEFLSPLRVGSYAATASAPDGHPIVRANRSSRLAGGGDSGDWLAVSGSFDLSAVGNVGVPTRYGVLSGSVSATLIRTNGSEALAVRGVWGCVIDPVANG